MLPFLFALGVMAISVNPVMAADPATINWSAIQ
jgi:hypothetical protein